MWTSLLALSACTPPPVQSQPVAFAEAEEVALTVDLVDGSSLRGRSANRRLTLRAAYGDVTMRLADVREVTFVSAEEGTRQAKLAMRNGDTLRGRLDLEEVVLGTVLGSQEVPVSKVTALRVTATQRPAGAAAYYPLEGGSAVRDQRVRDASGNGHDCVVQGATPVSDRLGREDGAYRFDGNDVIDCGDVLNDLSVPFTLAAWVYLEKTTGSAKVVSLDEPPRRPPSRYFGGNLKIRSGRVAIGYSDGGSPRKRPYRIGKAVRPLPSGKWVHITGVANGPASLQVYVDGKKTDTRQLGRGGANIQHSSWSLHIGPRIKGIIDEVVIYDRALTKEEVRQLHQSR